ncbi:hypothetical protein JL722_1375 [Aureococcus anophagefferens]|nr:hypothetical protein JL722_1375 [Aureococcus anophagefferens]
MVGCRAVAVLLLALVSAVAEDAAEDAAARLYLVEGVAPAAGRLEAAAVERAVEALSLDVAAGGLAPPDAVAAGERAVAAGLGFAGAALLNNAASNDFAAAARAAAAAVVDLDPGDLAASATALAGAEADVVVYLALGLSHVTYNLARCRLAPVQVVFGHGHPMSAGLGDAIDYFVSSKLYEADVANLMDGDAGRLAVFLPRMPREDLLAIVRVSDALLDTHPWGGGVTVLEALAVCTPPVVLPSRTSVLQLAAT